MDRPDFKELALEWLVRATGHVPVGREQSLAVEFQKIYEAGVERAAKVCNVKADVAGEHPLVERFRTTGSITRAELDSLEDIEVLKALVLVSLQRARGGDVHGGENNDG
jgi:hypothetical protein